MDGAESGGNCWMERSQEGIDGWSGGREGIDGWSRVRRELMNGAEAGGN